MPEIMWTMQPVEDGYQALVKTQSDLLTEESGNGFAIKETYFVNKMGARAAVQEVAYRLEGKLAA